MISYTSAVVFLSAQMIELPHDSAQNILEFFPLVGDIIHNSLDKDEIRMSDATFDAMNEFLNKNVE